MNLTTCNSINIGRILGQLFYYFYTCKNDLDKTINISIPTGNMGNSLSCYISKQMGLPINKIILACNHNSELNNLLNYKNIKKNNKTSTLANAIDIINPSNLERLHCLINNYNKTNKKLEYLITTKTNNKEIEYMINYYYYNYNIVIDPHTAVALDGLLKKTNINIYNPNIKNIIMSTASPLKFYNEIDYKGKIKLSDDLINIINKKEFIIYSSNYEEIEKNILKN